MQITSNELKQEIIFSVHEYSEAYLVAVRELARINRCTGGMQFIERYIHGLDQVVVTAVKNLIGQIPSLTDDRFKQLFPSEFFCLSKSKSCCMSDVDGYIPLMQHLSNGVTQKLVVALINMLNNYYPFDSLSESISSSLKKFDKEESVKPLKRFFNAEDAQVKESGILFTFDFFSAESTYLAFNSLDKALAIVAEECDFKFGCAINSFTATLIGNEYIAGKSFGNSKGSLSSHIKIHTFKKHIRITLSLPAFEAVSAYMLSCDDRDIQEQAASLIELLTEA